MLWNEIFRRRRGWAPGGLNEKLNCRAQKAMAELEAYLSDSQGMKN